MEYLLGLLIALAIGVTGVGAGIITAPVLILFYHVPPAIAVGTSLIFGVVTKVTIVPAYALRRQINYGVLLRMLAGGIPGVILGTAILQRVDISSVRNIIGVVLGLTIMGFALFGLFRIIRPKSARSKERPILLGVACFPIGAEVGFSSAGSGSLASLALMAWTKLQPATVVGTDVGFGLAISLIGGGVLFSAGQYDSAILPKLLVGGVIGALLAPQLITVIPARALRIGLLVWITFLGSQLVAKGVIR